MATQGKKKRNHYVPRLVLRNFSPDGRTISVLLLSSCRRVTGASLRDQCYRDYFYGRDGKVEGDFMVQEGRIASLLMPIDINRLERLNEEELAQVRSFVFQQRERTLAAAHEFRDLNAAMTEMLHEYGMGGGEDDVRAFEEKEPISQRFARNTVVDAESVIADLEVKFLISPKASSGNKCMN